MKKLQPQSVTRESGRQAIASGGVAAKMYRKGGRPGWRAVRAIVDAAIGHVRTGLREAEQEESRQEESRQEESRQEASAGHLPVRIADPVDAARVAAGNKTAYRALADAIRKRADQKATAAAVA